MTPERLAKIKAIAEDVRGHPNVRAAARRILETHEPKPAFADVKDDEPPPRPQPRSPRHPGVYTADEYSQHQFMNLGQWGRTVNGNLIHTFTHKKRDYRVVLFMHKKRPTYGWLRIDIQKDVSKFSDIAYASLAEAHRAAWENLTKMTTTST